MALFENSQRVCADIIALMRKKNEDYANPAVNGGNEYFNFDVAGLSYGLPTAVVIGLEISKKATRLANLITKDGVAAVNGESLDDTLDDIIGYALILRSHRIDEAARSAAESEARREALVALANEDANNKLNEGGEVSSSGAFNTWISKLTKAGRS